MSEATSALFGDALRKLAVILYATGFVGCLFLPLLAGIIVFGVLGLSGLLLADAWLTDREAAT